MSYQHIMDVRRYNSLVVTHPSQLMQMTPMPGPEQPQNNGDESEEEDDEDSRTLFCGNLDDRVTEELFYEIFLQAGPIEKAKIPKDNAGRQRSFGFVTYVHRSTPLYALNLYQGLSLFRKSLTIKYQGNSNSIPSPMKNTQSSGYHHSRYDNSSLRGGNYSSNIVNSPQNPFKRSPEIGNRYDNNSMQSRISNSSPYNRRSGGGGGSEERHRDHNRDNRRNYHGGSNRHSNQRNQR